MYRSVYKLGGYVPTGNEEKRIIDNNAIFAEKVGTYLHSAGFEESPSDSGGFVEGLEAPEVDALFTDDNEEVQRAREELRELQEQIEEQQNVLDALKIQADGMIDNAKAQIGAMQMKAYEEAKSQGEQEGMRLGRLDADNEIAEYKKRKQELEQEYAERIDSLEPEMVRVLTGIYEHIFKVDLAGYRDLVTDLILNALQHTEGERTFLVHVAATDHERVLKNWNEIKLQAGGDSARAELIPDMVLSAGQCYIETESGVYDCSLDTELSELSRKLQLLSYKTTD